MSDEVLGAVLPDGIDVDEHSAYFGITDSSALIERLAETDRLNGLGEFLSITGDLLLKQSSFDFQTAADRLEVEGGEIYWLLSGPFGMLSWTDPIRLFLGQPDSEGKSTGSDPGLPVTEKDALDAFNDPFRLLKMLAIGHVVGGLQELDQYLANFESWMEDVSGNKIRFLALHQQISQVLSATQSGDEATSLSSLTGGPIQKAPVKAPEGQKEVVAVPEPEPAPVAVPEPEPAPVAVPEPEPAPVAVPEPEVSLASAFEAPLSPQQKKSAFDEMDLDGDGVITPEEFQAAPEVSKLPESEQKVLFEQIDSNKDNVLQETEFFAAVDDLSKTNILAPKRKPIGVVKPVSAPISKPVTMTSEPIRPVGPSGPNNPQRRGRGNAIPGVHHTLQSGAFCPSCNIGVERHWRHCPVCGSGI
jgi:hypothetical protein